MRRSKKPMMQDSYNRQERQESVKTNPSGIQRTICERWGPVALLAVLKRVSKPLEVNDARGIVSGPVRLICIGQVNEVVGLFGKAAGDRGSSLFPDGR